MSHAPEVVLVHLAGVWSTAYSAPYENLDLGSLATCLERTGVRVLIVDEALGPGGWDACVEAALSARRVVVVDVLYRTIGDALRFAAQIRGSGDAPLLLLTGDAARSSARHLVEKVDVIDGVIVGDPGPAIQYLVGTKA